MWVDEPRVAVRRYTMLLERGETEDVWVASVPALPGCVTQGRTIEATIERAREAVAGHMAALADLGEPVPDDTALVVAGIEVETVASPPTAADRAPMRYIIVDFAVEVPEGVDAVDLTRRLADRFVDAVEAEGAVMGGGLRPATEAEVLARYDALEAAEAALQPALAPGED
jgi:antitoxin HicB